MRNLKVASKLILGFAIVAIATVIVGAMGIYGMSRLARAGQRVYENDLLAAEAMGDIREAFQQERVYFRDMYIYIDEPAIVKASIEGVNAAHLRGDAAVQRYVAAMADQSLEGAFFEAGALLDGQYYHAKEIIMRSAEAGDAQKVLEGIEEAVQYVSTIEDRLATSQKNHVAWAAEQFTRNANLSRVLIITQGTVMFAACLAALLLGVYISSVISRPLILLTEFMNKAGSTGDITLRQEDVENIEKHSHVKDEIGQCIASCANFLSRLAEIGIVLERVADGDLTAAPALLSEKDSMGHSLEKMLDNLNRMFHEIGASNAQVLAGAKQIADGAQTLAQGSTEQASVIEELSSTMSEIAGRTKGNAEVAREAAELSVVIKGNAEKGSRDMEQMMEAVQEINAASSQIERVIKVIDDIAFQTKILALNAAVEAARAGEVGKGFAVVAEEVRNLAAKSAAAAKDTGGLIEDSVAKANLGLGIAEETAASLREIVEGINRSAEIVEQIARTSDEQAGAITEIDTGIDQVAKVVQLNSATSQENAAASQEMSGQSSMLYQLISQFKLKEHANLFLDFSPAQQEEAPSDQLIVPAYASGESGDGFGKY